ncbi:HAD family hydrolase [Solibacillus sp. FSL H8-0523]|uniref:HAD family hydrolase n=1 Tax=Solibacillus sp. FSL H8-0523 TaxID=2954511 RepID=UPI0031010E96
MERKPPKQTTDLNMWWQWVRKFHLAFNHPAPDVPTMLTEERIMKRNSWMQEECKEMLEAKTLEDQVDAAIDKLYFALGDLVELGVKPNNLLRIVQKANMGKLHNVDGKMIPVYKEDGKIKKPVDWEVKFAPEEKLKDEIARQTKKK